MLNYNHLKTVGTLFVMHFLKCETDLKEIRPYFRRSRNVAIRKVADVVKPLQASPCIGRHSDMRL